MTRRFKHISLTVAALIVLSVAWGIYASNQRPRCTPRSIVSAQEIDRQLASFGYVVLQQMKSVQGCYYRVVTTPLGLRAVVIYDPDTARIVISKWDYLD